LNTARFRILWNRFIGDKLVVLGAVLVFLFLVIAVFGPSSRRTTLPSSSGQPRASFCRWT